MAAVEMEKGKREREMKQGAVVRKSSGKSGPTTYLPKDGLVGGNGESSASLYPIFHRAATHFPTSRANSRIRSSASSFPRSQSCGMPRGREKETLSLSFSSVPFWVIELYSIPLHRNENAQRTAKLSAILCSEWRKKQCYCKMWTDGKTWR